MQDNFLDGTSSTYLEELEERYISDPSSVDKTWASFFNNLGERSHHAVQGLPVVSQSTDERRTIVCFVASGGLRAATQLCQASLALLLLSAGCMQGSPQPSLHSMQTGMLRRCNQ